MASIIEKSLLTIIIGINTMYMYISSDIVTS
jgi:hypothetical protein